MNNRRAAQAAKWQYLFLATGKGVDPTWVAAMNRLPVDKLTPLQRLNLKMNLQLVEVEEIRNQKEGVPADDVDDDIFA
jgi:hypothetical protein